MDDLKVGLVLWSQCADWSALLNTGILADQLGFSSLWTWDHLYSIDGSDDRPILEAWGVLNAWAAVTRNIHLGTLCTSVPIRNPGLVAKQAVTLDQISGGRAILGLGAGWYEEELLAHGLSFGRTALERGRRLQEATSLIRALLNGETVTAKGEYYDFSNVRHFPSPVQERLPILLGGSGRKTTLPTVARHADLWNPEGSVQELEQKDQQLRELCESIGRDPNEIERTYGYRIVIRDDEDSARGAWDVQARELGMPDSFTSTGPPPSWFGPPEMVAEGIVAYQKIGFATLLVELAPPFDVQTMERLATEVIPMVRSMRSGGRKRSHG